MTDLQAHLQTLVMTPGDAVAMAAVEEHYRQEARWEELLRVYEDNALRGDKVIATTMLRKAGLLCIEGLTNAQRAEGYLTRALELSPADLPTLQALRGLHLARGDYERATEVYERELARLSEPLAKARGFVDLAEICREKLHRDDRALGYLKQALRADKNHAPAYRAVATIQSAQGRLDLAFQALTTEQMLVGPTDDFLDRMVALATLLLEHPKLHDLAHKAVAVVLSARPQDGQALAIRDELASYELGWTAKVVELSQQAIALGRSQPAQTAEMWLRVAEVQAVYGKQPEAALGSLDKAMAHRPGHPGALRLMEELYGHDDRFEDLALKLEMMAAYAREPAVAVELYLKAAMHHAVRLDNPEAAAGVHHRVLELDPGNKVSSNALAEYYRERKQWDEALKTLKIWAECATQASDKVAAHYACCRILEEEVGDKVRARPHYEAILALDPTNQAAAQALEEVYRQAGDHAALAKALHGKLHGATAEERLGLLTEMGDLYAGPLQQPAEALEALGQLYVETPSQKLRERMEELAAEAQGFAKLVQILEGGLEKIRDDADRIQALHSLAALYEGAREAPLEALRIHRRILALSPDDPAAKQAFERLLNAAAQNRDKLAFYREQAAAASSMGERITVLKKLAQELVDTAKDYVQAIDVYREIVRLAPEDLAAAEGLLTLYRRDQRWAEVAEALMQKRERTSENAARTAIELELAQLCEARLGEVDRAVEWLLSVLTSAPAHEDALQGLERLLSRAKRVTVIAETLQPYYLAKQRWDRAAAMMEIRVRGAGEPATRVGLLRDLAALHETRLAAPAQALAVLLRAFQLEPLDEALQQELERLAALVSDYSGIIRAYRAAALGLEAGPQGRLLRQAALLAERAGDLESALLDLLRVLSFADAGSTQALAELSRLAKHGLTRDIVTEAAAKVAAGLDGDLTTKYWRTLARFYEHDMNSTTDAIGAWKTVLAQHQNDPEAMAELDRLYAGTGDPNQLVEHLQTKLAAAVDDVTRAALGGQIAEILADKLNNLDGAVQELQKVAELAPGQRLVWRRLADLHIRASRPAEAAQALYSELGLLPDGDERYERLVVYAELVGKHLGDIPTAMQALKGLMTQVPTHAGGLKLLEEFHHGAADPALLASIADLLLPGYRTSNNWARVVELLANRVEGTTEIPARVALLKEIAALRAEKLKDTAGAFADLERAFHDTPADAEIRYALEKAAEATNNWQRLADAYNGALGAIADAATLASVQRKLAEVLDKRLGRGQEAIEHYRAAMGGQLPDDLPSLEAMERLLRQQNRQAELVDVLQAISGKLPATDQAKRITMLMEVAQLAETVQSDKARALEVYKTIAEIDAKDDKALRQLDRLLDELNQPQERAEILEKLVARASLNPQIVDDLWVE